MGLWIGRPGALREVTDGAVKFDRSPDLGVSEFRALSGGVTTWIPPVRPRRLRVEWSAMQRGDVAHLDRLARRIDAAGPVAFIDPLAQNLLSTSQALGLGAPDKWAYTKDVVTLFNGIWDPYAENRVGIMNASEKPAELYWQHPPGWAIRQQPEWNSPGGHLVCWPQGPRSCNGGWSGTTRQGSYSSHRQHRT